MPGNDLSQFSAHKNIPREFRGASYIDFPSEYCIVDIETTGLNFYCDEIIEIGAVKYLCGKIAGQFQTLVQPSMRNGVFVSSFIENLTGITNEMLSSAPQPYTAIKDFAEFLGDSIIAGYNVSFDVNFLYDCCMKHLQRPLTNNFIDVLRIARRLCADLPSHNLDAVTEHFGIKAGSRHRAIGDCLATELVYEKLKEEALNNYGTLQDFSRTFKSYVRKNPGKTKTEVLEEWKQGLDACPSVYKAFKFFERLGLKKTQLCEFAEYLGIALYKNVGKDEIIRKLVYATAGENLKDDPLRRSNIEKYERDTANHSVMFVLSLMSEDAD